MGQLVLNFRPVAGGFKCDVESQFFACLFLGATEWENTWGAAKFKSRLFLNRSIATDKAHRQVFMAMIFYILCNRPLILLTILKYETRNSQHQLPLFSTNWMAPLSTVWLSSMRNVFGAEIFECVCDHPIFFALLLEKQHTSLFELA